MLKELIKRLARPFRELLGHAIIIPPSKQTDMSLMRKVAHLIASDKIEGDYLEFGVFRGNSFIESYRAMKEIFEERIRSVGSDGTAQDARERQEIWKRMRFFAFDSFEGLPDLRGVDAQTRDFAKGQYAAGIDEFLANVARAGVPSEKVVCVPGWFDRTCTRATIEKHGLRKAAVIWVDCDLYHSAKSVLQFITPLLQDGTVIVFDDWYCFRGNPWRGEQRAFAEWKEQDLQSFAVSEYQKEGPWRNSFVVSAIPTGAETGTGAETRTQLVVQGPNGTETGAQRVGSVGRPSA
jgi:O-methyltransferase